MAKIVQRVINHKYFSIQADFLKEGTVVPFDCYIKRFGDYVIIIEAGTLINPALYEKIEQNQTIYVYKHDAAKVKEYYETYRKTDVHNPFGISKDEMVSAVLKLDEQLASSVPFDKRLRTVYTTCAGLMEVIFESSDERLPLEALQACVIHLVEHVNAGINVMPSLLKIIPEEYSAHHHSCNVAFFAAILSKAINISKEEMVDIAFAGLLHDIGKIRIDESILLKAGPLDTEEYEIMKRHPDDGFVILHENGIASEIILNGVRYHHEKLDGTGYPKQLSGTMIPTSASIIGMCDVFDALTTKRTYRTNYTTFEALLLIKRKMNTQFDERFTDAFIRLLR